MAKSVSPGTVRAASCTGSLSAVTLVAGQSGLLTVQAKDGNNNVLSSGGLAFSVKFFPQPASGPTLATTTTDGNNGTYTLPFQLNVAATYSIAVTLSGTPIAGSPFALTVLPGKTRK